MFPQKSLNFIAKIHDYVSESTSYPGKKTSFYQSMIKILLPLLRSSFHKAYPPSFQVLTRSTVHCVDLERILRLFGPIGPESYSQLGRAKRFLSVWNFILTAMAPRFMRECLILPRCCISSTKMALTLSFIFPAS